MAAVKRTIFTGKTVVREEADKLAVLVLGKDFAPLFVLSSGDQHYGRIRPDGSRLGPVWIIPRKDGCLRIIYRMPKDSTDKLTAPTFKVNGGCHQCDGRDWQHAIGDAAGAKIARQLIVETLKLHGVKVPAVRAPRKRTAKVTPAATPAPAVDAPVADAPAAAQAS